VDEVEAGGGRAVDEGILGRRWRWRKRQRQG
jgi:hypothetical protein